MIRTFSLHSAKMNFLCFLISLSSLTLFLLLSFIETVYSSTLMLFAVVEFHLKFSIIIIVIAHASLRSHEKTFYLRLLQIVIRWCFFFLESNMLLIILTFLFPQILFFMGDEIIFDINIIVLPCLSRFNFIFLH